MKLSSCLKMMCCVLLAFTRPRAGFAQQPDQYWWKHAVIYEIYPRSFGDTNSDGVGDLNGITAHLDYLKDLGVDGIWITPFFPSPQVDFGYDVSDFRGIDPQYGTMADFDRLSAEAKKRGIRIITDLVVNHTSDQHPWFLESASSRTNVKADWYIWREGKSNGRPPNNWISNFGGSAWQYEPKRQQFYYHEFYIQQPDLNWRNEEVRNAMWDVVRFWMDKGVSGFRLDAMTYLFENTQFRDEPVRPGKTKYGDPVVSQEYTNYLPEVHDVLRELRTVTNKYPGTVLIGETYVKGVEDLLKLYGAKNDEVHLPMDTQFGFLNRLSAADFRTKLVEAETELNGNTPLLVVDNHDNDRSWNRYGDGVHNLQIAKLLATVLLTPRASALIYYGQELGMQGRAPLRKEEVRDPVGKTGWPKDKGRDAERTPMQWNADINAGFSSARQTWLPVAPDYKEKNVSAEQRKPDSLLNYYKSLLRLRKENSALRDGQFALVDGANPDVLSFLHKNLAGKSVLVSLNFSANPQTVDLNSSGLAGGKVTTLLASFSEVAAPNYTGAIA